MSTFSDITKEVIKPEVGSHFSKVTLSTGQMNGDVLRLGSSVEPGPLAIVTRGCRLLLVPQAEMELRNAFKLRFNRHHTIHQVSPLHPAPISIKLFPRERERERERR
jgi:hypothetical protein